MKLKTLTELLVDQLQDIYSAEKQLLKALPKMVKSANTPSLKEALEKHLGETERQIERLDSIADTLGEKLTGKKCKGMEGLLEEGAEALDMKGEPALHDAALIAAAQRVEHYEIAAYGTARAMAEQCGMEDIAELLAQTLEEEELADEKLSMICEEELYPSMGDDQMAANS